ncbi:MAG: MlaD family protein [Pseudomonadota bacterium]
METRANYALIGAFVLFAAAAVIAFTLWLGTSQLNRDYAEYDIIFEGPVSLEEGASVRYIGIKVGEVETVRIDRRDASKVRARIRIDKTTPIKEDSTASIDIAGITGLTFIQINAGTETMGPLRAKPGQSVPVIESVQNPLAMLFASGAEIAGRAGTLLDSSDALLSDQNIATFSALLSNANSVMATLAEHDETLIEDARRVITSLEQASADVSLAADATYEAAAATEAELKALSAELNLLLADVRTATGTANEGLAAGRDALLSAQALIEGPTTMTLNETRATAQDVRTLIARLDRIARDLETNPQGFVVGTPRPYEEAR